MQDNQTKYLYSVATDEWSIDQPPKKWTVEKETERTFTIHDAQFDAALETGQVDRRRVWTRTVRKATMEFYSDVYALSYEGAIEKKKELVKREIEMLRERIADAEKKIEKYERIYAEIAGNSGV